MHSATGLTGDCWRLAWGPRDMVVYRGDRCVGLLVGPDGIDRALATGRNAVIGAVALVRAVGDVVRAVAG
jgi:hypothetical protein